MPIYEYRCNDCQQVFEEWQKGFEDLEKVCPICGGASSRLISNSAFVLKGSGWYVTDYCGNNSAAGNGDGKTTEKEKSAPATETKASDTGSTPATSSSQAS
ncbi:FmdB family zinc ribbon protein [Desulfonatronovibrio magnus]|uniref:FmdB family zinc ribbon protein n=1 Tax=Desulfonatronovibrio magnus TaxID=698827 RepID=UPI0005EAFA5A|nr:zinc ribbon domain-containing protein [Desulfonatronovibrio magnus]